MQKLKFWYKINFMDEKEKLIKTLVDDGYLKTPTIIDAFRKIDRADFVLPEYKNEAYGNYPLPIGAGQTISQPLTVAFMLELLDPKPGEKILDIGAGSGWQTSLLAHIVSQKGISNSGKIVALERVSELCKFAQKNIDKYSFIKNGVVEFFCQDATAKIPDGPYDKIIAAAAATKEIPKEWRDKLKVGGKIVAPIGGSVWMFTKKSDGEWDEIEYPGFAFVPLISDKQPGTGHKGQKLNIKNQISKIQSKNKKYQPLWIFTFLFLILAAVSINEVYRPHASFGGSKSVLINPGLGSRQIAELLKKEGVIRSKWIFVAYAALKGAASNLKPGDYIFSQSSIAEILRDLERGGTNEIAITIPEGWTLNDIAAYLDAEKIARKEDFFTLTDYRGLASIVNKYDFLKDKPANRGLEGYLFPDTYRIFKDAKAEDIVKKMLDNFGQKLTPDLRTEILKQKKSIFEIVTMASMIEREVISDEDRAIVSGVLWKRLENNIGLQVDATVNYIKQQTTNNKQLTTKISIDDTKIDSLYNTYKYRGLPYGPISNPGISAIKAAIYPKSSPYFYYLSASDGETIFSKTLEEHNTAKRKYLTK